MAGSCDRSSGVGGKSRGTRSQFRLEDLQPFKSVYPLHLTDIMDAGLSTQTGPLSGASSPYKETRTLAVREYETMLDKLRRENFDLKLKLYLANKQYQPNCESSCDSDNALEVVINMKVETEKLRNDLTIKEEDLQAALEQVEQFKLELSEKDQALKDALENVEKFTTELSEKEETLLRTEELAKKYELETQELQGKIEELKVIFKQYPSSEEVLEIKEQLTLLSNTNDYLNNTLEESNSKIAKLEAEKAELTKKVHMRNLAIQGCSKRYNEDIGMPSDVRLLVKNAIGAAKEANKADLLLNVENLKSTLFGLMPESSKENISSSSLGESQKQGSSKERESRKLQEKIDNRSSRNESNHEEIAIPNKETAIQTDLQWHSIESKLSDKQAQGLGVSDDIEELREEVLMLLLAFEQTEKDLTDTIQKLENLQSEEENVPVKDTTSLVPNAEDFAAERTDLQRRLAISCSINNELMKYLKSLEKFMEDLLYQKNYSTSSLENINETSEFFTELSKCLDQSLKLSQVLSDQLSICEGSKIFDPNDVTLTKEDFNLNDLKSYEFDPESRFSQTESDLLSVTQEGMNNFNHSSKDYFKSSFKAGKRRLSFSSEQKSATEADNVIVLKTGNNEDVILVLDSNGDPEDVLIRNNGSFADKMIDSDQFRRRCWDTAMNDPSWNAEKFSIAHYKENPSNLEQMSAFKPSGVRYNSWMSSDSDTWSEPDRNISLQRIGIDIQTSPVTSKSPRRARFKERRLSDDSTKNESACSYVKLHSWSKRRRCSDASKFPFVCKKCRKQYLQIADVAPEDVSIIPDQEVRDLYSRNAKQQKELENLQQMLVNKENLLQSLQTEKQSLQSEINTLKEELQTLKNNNDALSLQNKTFSNNLTKEVSGNTALSNVVKDLEKKAADSDVICDDLRQQLHQTKERLMKLEENCSNYIAELSSVKQANVRQENEIRDLKAKETDLLTDIKELTSEKNSLLDSLNKEKERKVELEVKNSELNRKLKERYKEMEHLKSAEREFMELKRTLMEEKQTAEEKLANSNSLCENLKLEARNLKDSLRNLKSKYDAYESKIESLLATKKNIQDSLHTFKDEFTAHLNLLRDLCNDRIDLKSDSLENIQSILMTKKCDDEQINQLLNEITCENLKLKKFSNSIGQKLQEADAQNQENKVVLTKEQNKQCFLKQELELKDSEIKNLKNSLSELQDSVDELKSTIMKYDYTEEIQKQQLSAALQKLNEKEEQIASLIEENKYWQSNFSVVQNQISDSEKSVSNKLAKTLKKLTQKEEEMKALTDKNNVLENNLQVLQDKLSSLENLLSLQVSESSEKLNEMKEELKTLNDKNNQLQNSLTMMQEKLISTENSKSLQLSELSKKLSEREDEVEQLIHENSHLKNNFDILQNQLSESDRSISVELSNTLQQLREKNEEVKTLIDENKNLHDRLHLLHNQLDDTERSDSKELSVTLPILVEKDERIKALTDKNNVLEKSLRVLQNKFSSLENSHSLHISSEKVVKMKEEIENLFDENIQLQHSLTITQEKLTNTEKSYSIQLSELSNKLSQREDEVEQLIQENNHWKNNLNVLQNQLTESDKSISIELSNTLDKLREKENEVKMLIDENKNLHNSLHLLHNKLEDSERSDSQKEELVKTLTNKNSELQNSLTEVQNQLESSFLQISDLTKKLSEKDEYVKVLIGENRDLQNNLKIYKNQLTNYRKSLSAQSSNALEQFGEKEEEVKTLTDENSQLYNSLNLLQSRLSHSEKTHSDQLSETLQKLNEKEEEVKTLIDENSRLQNNLQMLLKKLSNVDKSDSDSEKLAEKDKEIATLIERNKQLEKSSSLLSEKLSQKDNQVKALIDKNSKLQYSLNSLQNQLSDSEKSFSSQSSDPLERWNEKEEKIKALIDKNLHLRKLKDKMPLQMFAAAKKLSEIEQVKSLQNLLDTSENPISVQLSEALQKLSAKEEEVEALTSEINHLHRNVNLLHNQTLSSEKSDSMQVSDTLQKLNEKEDEVKALIEENNYLQNNLLMLQKQLADSRVAGPSDDAVGNEKLASFETVEKYKLMLDSKNKDIEALQERIVSLQDQISKLLDEKINRSQGSSQSIETDSETSAKSEKTGHPASSSSVQTKKEHEKCIRKIKSLQSKLEMAEKRVENLEKEKANLKENLLSYIHQAKQTSSSKKDLTAELSSKESFIKELKSELYKAHDSVIDKQKEIDKLQQELAKYKDIIEGGSKTTHGNIPSDKFSDILLDSAERSISDLRKRKHQLIDSLLELQKQFYESKNIPLDHFNKFYSHIENLRSLQVHPTLVKSESVPVVNKFSPSKLGKSQNMDISLKNTKIDLEVDIECLQNLRLFFKRFFTSSMNQGEVKKEECIPTITQNYFKSEKLTKTTSVEQLSLAVGSSHDRLTSTTSHISQKLDCMESDLKSVFEEFSQIYPTNETSRIAVSILQKISERVSSLQDCFEDVAKFISMLKSLDKHENITSHNASKQDMSDQESLLSEETITLSRSESLSPVSFDSRFRFSSLQQETEMQDSSQSHPKQLDDSRRVPLRPFHRLLSSSQDSVFQRSHYSSPDLGIESDPNHEHSAPEQAEKAHALKILNSKTELSSSDIQKLLSERPSIYSLSSSSLLLKDVNIPITISDTLHAIGILQEYELLKKEVAESLVGIKSVLARTGDGLHHIASYTSPRKKLEYTTFKAIKDTCLNIEVCLQKAHKLIQNFWVAPCPSEEELKQLLQQNEELNTKIKRLFESKKKQENDFKDVIEKLKQAELIKEQQEQKISKRLVKTKKVLRLAEKKLLETKNLEFPFMVKHSSKVKQ